MSISKPTPPNTPNMEKIKFGKKRDPENNKSLNDIRNDRTGMNS